jgi:hypothetical protein
MWKMVHSGIAKVGMRLNGRLPREARGSIRKHPDSIVARQHSGPDCGDEVDEPGDVEKRNLTAPGRAAAHDRQHDERRREADGHVTGAGRPASV